MKGFSQTIEIKEIMLLTNNNDITLTGVINKNMMHYETQMSLDSTQLNLVINQLQKLNPENEIAEMFHTIMGDNGQMVLFFDTRKLLNYTLGIETFTQNQTILQIRA